MSRLRSPAWAIRRHTTPWRGLGVAAALGLLLVWSIVPPAGAWASPSANFLNVSTKHPTAGAMLAAAELSLGAGAGTRGDLPGASPLGSHAGILGHAMATSRPDVGPAAQGWWNLTATAGQAPIFRVDFGLAYDARDGYVVLFGGDALNSTFVEVSQEDTWIFSGDHWTQLRLATHPSGREAVAMAYDPAASGVILFGGINYTKNLLQNDTWLFQGGSWTNISFGLTVAPGVRSASQMVYSPSDSGLILYGGCDLAGCQSNTWLLASGAWRLIPASTPPPARIYFGLAYDSVDGYILLFGGYNVSTSLYLQDTWRFSSDTWSPLSPSVSPTARIAPAMAFDSAAGYVLLFGGSPDLSNGLTDTWTFSAGSWTQPAPTTHPQGRWLSGAVFDGADGYVMIFSGDEPGAFRNDTWAWAPPLAALPKATPAGTDVGASVQFSSNATGGVPAYSYAWTFGDGATSLLASPGHTYLRAGTFVANLTAMDRVGVASTVPLTVTVNSVPVVTATSSLAAADVGSNLSFHATAVNGTSPFTFHWAFGDGSAATTQNANHLYSTSGTFSVNLTGTDAVGQVRSTTIVEHINPPPSALASAPSTSTSVGTAIAFTSSASLGTPPYSFHWDFGDGLTASTQNVSHGFTANGGYDVTLTVTDAVGGHGTSTVHITVGSASGSSGLSGTTLGILIGAAIAVAAIVGGLAYLRSRRGGSSSSTGTPSGPPPGSLSGQSPPPPSPESPPGPPPP